MNGENRRIMEKKKLNKITTKERKIGKTTFIISTSFNDNKQRDVYKIISRLIQLDLSA